jgi:predicted metal-dependent phosphotriesterase family hydrolase
LNSMVATVNGPVPISDLGFTLPHEHLFANQVREYRGNGLLNDESLAILEIQKLVESGGRTLIDCTIDELGRDPLALQRVSRATGLNIVMGCGHYRDPYLDSNWFDKNSVDAIAELMIRDLNEGVDDTGVRSGIIGEIGADKWFISAAEERSFRAAARAHRATGVTITTHAARWPVGIPQLDLLAEEGVDPRRVIIGHCDMVPTSGYHEALAKRGSWVEFDTIRGESEYDTNLRVEFVVSLVELGFTDHVLISHDLCLRTHMSVVGGCGYDFIIRDFIPRLRNAGLDEETIHRITVENPARALTVQ